MKKKLSRNNLHWLILLFFSLLIGLFIGLKTSNFKNVQIFSSTSDRTVKPVAANVLYVIDGDTIDVSIDGKKERVRLLGIDAPEMGFEDKTAQCFAHESQDKLKELIDGSVVWIASDSTQENRDMYNRLLRYMYLPDGTHVNKVMVEQGYAYEYTYKDIPYKFQVEFQEAEQNAKTANVGLWANGACQ